MDFHVLLLKNKHSELAKNIENNNIVGKYATLSPPRKYGSLALPENTHLCPCQKIRNSAWKSQGRIGEGVDYGGRRRIVRHRGRRSLRQTGGQLDLFHHFT